MGVEPASQTISADRCLTVIDKLNRLPPFHPAVLKLLNISIDEDSAETDYEEAFKSDPSLTADLLLMANSAAYGQRSAIQTIHRAIRSLGLESVRSLATAIALRAQVQCGTTGGEYLLTVWAHSIATAVAAEAIGGLHGLPGLYTSGLTHDLGRLGLFLSVGNQYAVELSKEFEDVEEANQRERALYGMTHCEAGVLMAREWGFPEILGTCMAEHHSLAETSNMSQRLIGTACLMASSLGFPEVPTRVLPPFPEVRGRAQARAGLEPEALWDEITRRIASLEG